MIIAIIMTLKIIVTIVLIVPFAIFLVVLTIVCFLTVNYMFIFVGCGRLIILDPCVRTSIL